MKSWKQIAIVLALPLVLVGCRREEPVTDTAATGTQAPAAESTDTELTTAEAKLAAEEPIAVTIREGGIEIQGEPLLAGATEFQVTNEGNQVHSLAIEGTGVNQRLERGLQPFEVGTLTVMNLPPGQYQVFCPFPGHADDAETTVVNVQPRDDTAPQAGATATTGTTGT